MVYAKRKSLSNDSRSNQYYAKNLNRTFIRTEVVYSYKHTKHTLTHSHTHTHISIYIYTHFYICNNVAIKTINVELIFEVLVLHKLPFLNAFLLLKLT